MDRRLAGLAARQGGVFTRGQAFACDYTRSRVAWQLKSGRWAVLRAGVYVETRLLAAASPGSPGRTALYVQAAALAVHAPTAAASHRTGALLHELDVLWVDLPDPLLVLTRPDQRYGSYRYRELHVYSSPLPAGDVVTRHGVAVTSPARTAVDLARTVSLRGALVTVDAALRCGTSLDECYDVLRAQHDWPGAPRAAEVLRYADPRSESACESLVRAGFIRQGLPAPESQVLVGGSEPIGRVDFLFRRQGVVVECDGMVKYTDPGLSEAELRRVLWKEKLRQEALELAGFVVVRVTWEEALHDEAGVARRVRDAFLRAERLRATGAGRP